MSSHHFVREGQEPALFIVDPFSLALVEPLLEWAPVVIVLDNAIPSVLKWKIKIDAVLLPRGAGRRYAEALATQGPVEILYYQSTEGVPDSITAFLAQQKCKGVNIIAMSSSMLFDYWIAKAKEFDISIIEADTKWSAILSTFQKWFPEGTTLRVRSSQNSPFNCIGLTQNTDELFLTEKNGVISIKSNTPFWLGESFEN